jgi:hypothetical protein
VHKIPSYGKKCRATLLLNHVIIDEWTKGKPKLLAMAAIELAFDAEYCFECAEQVKIKKGFISNEDEHSWVDIICFNRYRRQLKENEILDLFDSIAKDKGQNDIDTNIPDSQETFATI